MGRRGWRGSSGSRAERSGKCSSATASHAAAAASARAIAATMGSAWRVAAPRHQAFAALRGRRSLGERPMDGDACLACRRIAHTRGLPPPGRFPRRGARRDRSRDRRARARLPRHTTPVEDSRCRRDHRCDDDGHHRAHRALPDAPPAGRLRRPRRPRPPNPATVQPVTDGSPSKAPLRPSRARPSRPGGNQDSRAATRVLPPSQACRGAQSRSSPSPASSRSSAGPAHQAAGLPASTPSARRSQTPPPRLQTGAPRRPRRRSAGPNTDQPDRQRARRAEAAYTELTTNWTARPLRT